MLRVALRGIRAHLVRFILSVAAVTLGVAFVAGTFALRSMISTTMDDIISSSADGDVYVRGPLLDPDADATNGTRGLIPVALADQIGSIDGVAAAVPDYAGPAVLIGADGTALGTSGAPSLGTTINDPDSITVKGRLPHGPDEIALDTATLKRSGLAVGDTTQVLVGQSPTDVTVVGDVTFDASMAGAILVIFDQDTAASLYAPDGMVNTIWVKADPGTDPAALTSTIDKAVGSDGVQVVSGEQLRTETKDSLSSVLGFIQTFLLIFAGISLFVGGFLIANTFTMLVRQRTKEFALLRAIGSSPLQVFGSIIAQAVAIGLIGASIGVFAGLGLVQALRAVLDAAGMAMSGAIPVNASMIVISLVTGLLVSVLAAAVPARRAALVPPIEAMRDSAAPTERPSTVRAVIGAVMSVLGLAGVASAAVWPDLSASESLLAAGAVLLVVGVLVLAPALARGIIAWTSVPLAKAWRPVGRLASGNVIRNPRRTANTAGALIIGVALVSAASVLAATTKASVSGYLDSELTSDVIVQSQYVSLPEGAVDDIAALPQTGTLDTFTVATAATTVNGSSDASDVVLGGTDQEIFQRAFDMPTTSGSVDDFGPGKVLLHQEAADSHGWAVGDTMVITGPSGTINETVVGIVDTKVVNGLQIFMTQDDLNTVVPEVNQQRSMAFVSAADGVTSDELKAAVTTAVAPYLVVSVMDADEFTASIAGQIDTMLTILYALLGMSLVIASLGIVNTLALSVIERTREIGLLRAVGLGRFQLAGMVTLESIITALFGTAIGLALGVGIASVMPRIYAEEGLSNLSVPWSSVAVMVVGAVAVGFLAALWPATRAARMPILDAVSSE